MALYNEIKAVQSLPLALRIAGANGSSIDRLQAGNAYEQLSVVVLAGTITDGTHAVTIQDSDDGTTWANVPAGQLVGTASFTTANQNTLVEIGVVTARRFVRVNTTVTGSPATGGSIAGIVILGDPSYIPAR